jgi:hypothetical protein
VSSYKITNFGLAMNSEVTVGNSLADSKIKPAISAALSFLPGATAGLCDRFYAEKFDLAGSASISFDFAAGALLGPDQVAEATWARVLAFALVLDPLPAGAANVVIGAASAPLGIVSDTVAAPKTLYNSTTGAWFGWGGGEPGVVVTATTADLVKVLNGDAVKHATGSICFIGRSA